MDNNLMGAPPQSFDLQWEPKPSIYEQLPKQHINLFEQMGKQNTRGVIEETGKLVASGVPLPDIDPMKKADAYARDAQRLAGLTEGMDDATFERLRQQLQAKVQERPQMPMVQQAQAPTSGQQIVAALGSILFPQYAAKVGALPYQVQADQAKIANENANRQYQSDFDAYKQNVDLAANDLQDFSRRDQFRVNQQNDSNRTQANLLMSEANRIRADINRIDDNKREDRTKAFGFLMQADNPADVEIASQFLAESGTPLPPDVIARAKASATTKQKNIGTGLLRDMARQIESYGGIQNEAQRAQYASYAKSIADQYGVPVPPMFVGKNIKGQTLDEKKEERKAKYKHLSEKEANNLQIANDRLAVAKQNADTARGQLGVARYKTSKEYMDLEQATKAAKSPVTSILDKLDAKKAGIDARIAITKDKDEKAKLQAEAVGIAGEMSQIVNQAIDDKVLTTKETERVFKSIAKSMPGVFAPKSPILGDIVPKNPPKNKKANQPTVIKTKTGATVTVEKVG